MEKVFIVSGCRTPIAKFQGQFEQYSAAELGTLVIKEVLIRASIKPEDIEQTILGQVLTAGQGQNPARKAAINAEIPNLAPAFTVNMLCGSGLKAIFLGFQAIRNKDCNILIAGGQESMTRAQHSAYLRGAKFGNLQLLDTCLSDGLTDAFNNIHMGNTAEHLAKLYKISRNEQDVFALNSQMKAVDAINKGYFNKEIVAVPNKKLKTVLFETDEFPRIDCNLEMLSKLKPVFDSSANGSVTAGNSSGLNDGAAVVVLANAKIIEKNGLKPLAEIIAFAEVGLDPICMGLGPIKAVKNVLKKANWTKEEVDLYELNEAFAVQSLICIRELGLDSNKVNISGGAIALGHPIGASGARCLITLIYNLIRLKKKKGIAALCIGGGMGIAIAIEIV